MFAVRYTFAMRHTEQAEAADHLGMTDAQWAQWQAYTRGYGEQDENGIDVSLLRQNLRLTPTERLRKHQKALRVYLEVHHARAAARLSDA
jgi:hypothetical protein